MNNAMKLQLLLAGLYAFTYLNIYAAEMPSLAKEKNCGGCHAIDKTVVGPAWTDVAKRYKQDKEAPIYLANKIQQGGGGIWGKMAMPKQHVTFEEAKSLVKFILSLPAKQSPAVIHRPSSASN